MKIESFNAEGIHGYLDFQLRFKDHLSFLTGINGSGKTSALNSIIALLTPDLAILANLDYAKINVCFSHENQLHTIHASSNEEQITLTVSGVEESFAFSRYSPDPNATQFFQTGDSEHDYYRDLLMHKQSHPVLKMIATFPKPMFLGIDRRSSFGMSRRPGWGSKQTKFGKNIFGQSLAGSVNAAANLAVQRYRDAIIQAGRLTERLQREMLLGLLGSAESIALPSFDLRLPNPDDVQELQRVREDMSSIASMMQLPEEEVRKRLLPLLDRLESSANKIPVGTKIEEVFRLQKDNASIVSAIAQWSANQPHLQRIRFISEKVADYNQLRKKAMEHTNQYEKLVNSFLEDSGKKISFVDDDTLSVDIKRIKGPRSISSLSSGEAQIFVILTHLAFNPAAQKNNVFIIDEPELSLHIQWQEMFVDSILKANPNIQFILATHSPSIILERVDDCLEISELNYGG